MENKPRVIKLSRFFDENVYLVAGMCAKCYAEQSDVRITAINRKFLLQAQRRRERTNHLASANVCRNLCERSSNSTFKINKDSTCSLNQSIKKNLRTDSEELQTSENSSDFSETSSYDDQEITKMNNLVSVHNGVDEASSKCKELEEFEEVNDVDQRNTYHEKDLMPNDHKLEQEQPEMMRLRSPGKIKLENVPYGVIKTNKNCEFKDGNEVEKSNAYEEKDWMASYHKHEQVDYEMLRLKRFGKIKLEIVSHRDENEENVLHGRTKSSNESKYFSKRTSPSILSESKPNLVRISPSKNQENLSEEREQRGFDFQPEKTVTNRNSKYFPKKEIEKDSKQCKYFLRGKNKEKLKINNNDYPEDLEKGNIIMKVESDIPDSESNTRLKKRIGKNARNVNNNLWKIEETSSKCNSIKVEPIDDGNISDEEDMPLSKLQQKLKAKSFVNLHGLKEEKDFSVKVEMVKPENDFKLINIKDPTNCPFCQFISSSQTSSSSAASMDSIDCFVPPGSQKPLWSPPRSPHNLIEESLYQNPWSLLVATIFLNKTSCMVARPYVEVFLAENPTPEAVLSKEPSDLEKYFVNLGLHRRRAEQVWRMSHDFLHKKWSNVKELYGIGKYGEDAYRMFCLGDMSVKPRDRFLRIYKAWYKMVSGEDASSCSDIGGGDEESDTGSECDQ